MKPYTKFDLKFLALPALEICLRVCQIVKGHVT